ncbi:MAG: preprotein translocase subunit SecG [Verrucomicrobiota bacterium]
MLNFVIYAVTALFAVASILLTLVILVQRPKSEGLGAAFGGGMTESLFGADTTDALTKITIWLTVFFFIATLTLAFLMTYKESSRGAATREILETVPAEVIEEKGSETPVLPPEAVTPESMENSEVVVPALPAAEETQ